MLQNTKNKKNNYKKMSEEYDYSFIVLLIGNNRVGKSSLLHKYMNIRRFNNSFHIYQEYVRKKNIN